MELHKFVIQVVDFVLFIVGAILLIVAVLSQSFVVATGIFIGVCLSLSVWSALRLIVDNTEKTRVAAVSALSIVREQLAKNNSDT